MIIAIDTSPLYSAHKNRGVGIYTKNLIEALEKSDSVHSYSFFTRKQNIPKNCNIVHYPYFDPFFLTLPLIKTKPTIVTVHDLIPLVFPDKFPPGLRGLAKWQIQKLSLLGARRIITDSKNSSTDISRITGINKDIIDVVYLAPGSAFKPIDAKRKIQGEYVLYVGNVNRNKNVQNLVKALKELKNMQLVVVGDAFTNRNLTETKEIDKLIHDLHMDSRITKTGHVSDEELVRLYRHAACLVLPSFYEGFGLPVLEAMASGCIVVCADNSSLSEIKGPAITIDISPESITKGIRQALSTDRDIQIKRQFEWVSKYTWNRVAQETIRIYEKT